jgi:hypothetical protein
MLQINGGGGANIRENGGAHIRCAPTPTITNPTLIYYLPHPNPHIYEGWGWGKY